MEKCLCCNFINLPTYLLSAMHDYQQLTREDDFLRSEMVHIKISFEVAVICSLLHASYQYLLSFTFVSASHLHNFTFFNDACHMELFGLLLIDHQGCVLATHLLGPGPHSMVRGSLKGFVLDLQLCDVTAHLASKSDINIK